MQIAIKAMSQALQYQVDEILDMLVRSNCRANLNLQALIVLAAPSENCASMTKV